MWRACLVGLVLGGWSCTNSSSGSGDPSAPGDDDETTGLPGTPGDDDDTVIPEIEIDISWTEVMDLAEVGTLVSLVAHVESNNTAEMSYSWSSDKDGGLGGGSVPQSGDVSLNTDVLTLGWHQIEIAVDQGDSDEVASYEVGICKWPDMETFDVGTPAGWTTFGDAYWDPGGWLEVTGNSASRAGQIYKTDDKVDPGNFAMEFSIATGGGLNGGADGFAVNIIDAYDVAELTTIVNAASNGGCLAYGTQGGPCGTMPISGFHVEFDTWFNDYDPTAGNHFAITLDGDPTVSYFWVDVPSLEDLAWRQIRIEVDSPDVTAFMDGQQIIQGTIPGFVFDGGYVGVSGSTGWATNYHRFDNLQIYDQCVVPE